MKAGILIDHQNQVAADLNKCLLHELNISQEPLDSLKVI